MYPDLGRGVGMRNPHQAPGPLDSVKADVITYIRYNIQNSPRVALKISPLSSPKQMYECCTLIG